MRTVLWHGLACSVAGALLAALGGIVCDLAPFATVIALGAGIGALLGGGVSFIGARHLRGLQKQIPTAAPASRPRPQWLHHLRARLGKDYRWISVSKPLCRLLRRTPRSLRGRPIFANLHPEDFGIVDKALKRA